jgi:hypothetical protein
VTWSPNNLDWDCDTCLGTLAIDGHSLNTMAWCVDLTPLWGGPDVRGENVIIPGVAGRARNPIRVDEVVLTLPLYVNGHWDKDGVAVPAEDAPYTGTWKRLQANLQYLMANVSPVVSSAVTTQTAVLTLPSGSTVNASVQVRRIAPGTVLPGAVIRTTIEIRDPAGALHL